MSVVVIVGDVHLGKGVKIGKPGISGALNSRIIDQINLLDWTIEQAVEHNADMLVFTGDICHDLKPHYKLVRLFIRTLKRCEASNLEVHIAGGNHDLSRTGKHYESVLDIITAAGLPKVYIHKDTNTILRDGVGITFLPYRDRMCLGYEKNDEALKLVSDQLVYEQSYIPEDWDKVLIGHLALEGSIFWTYRQS
jgi:DNA repair exonuclease SbcCD nuclease subunit